MTPTDSASENQALEQLIAQTDGMMSVLRIHQNSRGIYLLPNSKKIIKRIIC
ncbi:MAG: hypothetical protein ACI9RZ_002202 [Sphingobacteriales bacterium]|jgi:hypothetical protein